MLVHVNVFTRGVGYSHWRIDLGFTLVPKKEIKKKLAATMDTWFVENKNVYTPARHSSGEKKSWIVQVSFD